MDSENRFPNRKNIRLPDYDYSQSGAYYFTICTVDRECLFGSVRSQTMYLNDAGMIITKVWDDLPNRFARLGLDAFIVMPNHVHGIIMLGGLETIHGMGAGFAPPKNRSEKENASGAASSAPAENPSLPDVIRAFKSISAMQVNRLYKRSGPLWQRGYHEHIIRNEKALLELRNYIQYNAYKWDSDEYFPS